MRKRTDYSVLHKLVQFNDNDIYKKTDQTTFKAASLERHQYPLSTMKL